jgi:hypothetical protein
MPKFSIPNFPPRIQLCENCEIDLAAAIHKAQLNGTLIDFHYCKHRSVLALAAWQGSRIANWSLHSHMSPESVVELFHAAKAQVLHVPVGEWPTNADTLN